MPQVKLSAAEVAEQLDQSLTMKSESSDISLMRESWEKDMDNNLARFQYASLLARSPNEYEQREAIIHLEYLTNYSTEFIRDSLYLLAVTRYLLCEYSAGRSCAEELMRVDPDNHQAQNLFVAMKYKHEKHEESKVKAMQQNAVIGVSVGIGVAVAGIALSILMKGKKR